MFLVLLCGGQGKRFQQVCPQRKPCQLIYSRMMYKWVIDSILDGHDKTGVKLVIATADDNHGKSILYNVRKEYGQFLPIERATIEYDTRGPVETCKLCLQSGVITSSFWVLDNDIIYDSNIQWKKNLRENELYITVQEMSDVDKSTYVRGGYSPYSHVTLAKDCTVTDIVEKQYVSEYIVLGAYGFGSPYIYNTLFDLFINNTHMTREEWFMSHIIKLAIANDIKVNAVISQTSIAIGTPEQVEQAVITGVIKPKPMRWVFDLDETLVTLPSVPGNYNTVEPIQHVIDFVKQLYYDGHYIIIHTARHMKTCFNDVDLVKSTMEHTTKSTLKRFDIPYHELIFGKPFGDIYVDDKSTNPLHWKTNWLAASLGFGWKPNIHESIGHKKIIKLSENLCMKIASEDEALGNITFVNTCPKTLLGHIPKIHNSIPIHNTFQIIMEWKADTITIGRMLAYGTLSDSVFDEVLLLLRMIHNCECPVTVSMDNVLDNYIPKFVKRYEEHSHIYKHLDINMNVIYKFFDSYIPDLIGMVHGDYWLSNLMWCHNERKIYMIDMRGRLGNIYTTNGDRNYDYAKLIQSIVGFDTIIHTGKRPPQKIQDKLMEKIKSFFNLSNSRFDDIKHITALLIIGSLPFHEELTYHPNIIKHIIGELWPSILSS